MTIKFLPVAFVPEKTKPAYHIQQVQTAENASHNVTCIMYAHSRQSSRAKHFTHINWELEITASTNVYYRTVKLLNKTGQKRQKRTCLPNNRRRISWTKFWHSVQLKLIY